MSIFCSNTQRADSGLEAAEMVAISSAHSDGVAIPQHWIKNTPTSEIARVATVPGRSLGFSNGFPI